MLYWTFLFLIIAIIAAVFGFVGIAVAAAGIAKILFVIFLILFLIGLAFHWRGGRHHPIPGKWQFKLGLTSGNCVAPRASK